MLQAFARACNHKRVRHAWPACSPPARLQSKIRDMRARLAAFDTLLQRQAGLFAELLPLGR